MLGETFKVAYSLGNDMGPSQPSFISRQNTANLDHHVQRAKMFRALPGTSSGRAADERYKTRLSSARSRFLCLSDLLRLLALTEPR